MLRIPTFQLPSSLAEAASYVATPVARQISRLIRSDQGSSEEFNAATYLVEVLLKYETICSLAILSSADKAEADQIGYDLLKSDGLGQWKESLQKATSAMTASGALSTASFTRALTETLEQKRKDEIAESTAGIWNEIGHTDFRAPRTRLALLEFFVSVRNRTRGHGAPLLRQYEVINPVIIQLLDFLIKSSPYLQSDIYAPIKLKSTNTYACRILLGVQPQRHTSIDASKIPDSKKLYLNVNDTILPLPDIIQYRKDDDGCFLLNSARRKNGKYDLIDYFTNRSFQVELSDYSLPPVRKPKSSTAGNDSLSADTFPLHNLPSVDFTNYISRKTLELELEKLLLGTTTNIITLGGEGGIGKTTLALRVVRKLANDGAQSDRTDYDYILWFSARDLDLGERGASRRERQVTSLNSCASLFEKLVTPYEPNSEVRPAIEYFEQMLSAGAPRFLLIFDNLESFDDTEPLQEFLRDHLSFPSKVLITSRERNVEGDRQVRVPGLTVDEARDLISRIARQVGCEPAVLDEKRVITIHNKTNGNPYAIKLVVNEIANGTSLDRVFSTVLNERYLTTLFRRVI